MKRNELVLDCLDDINEADKSYEETPEEHSGN